MSEVNLPKLLGLSSTDAEEIIKMIEDLRPRDGELGSLIEVVAEKFEDPRALFAGYALGHMVAKMHYGVVT